MIINDSFRKLIPPLTPDEYAQLEANCLADGIRDPLVVWQGVLIDGHNRLAIAEKHGLDYAVVEKEFEDEDGVIDWMCANQLGRRNLTDEQRAYLIGIRYKNEKKNHGGDRKSSPQNGYLKTESKVAQEYGISKNTVQRNAQFAEGIDKLTDELRGEVLAGKAKTNKADIQEIAKAEPYFVATTEKEIIAKASEIREKRKEEKKAIVAEKEAEYVAKIAETTIFDVDIFNTDKKFNIIYADPAWSYWEGGEKNQSMHYKTMGIDDIKNLPVSDIADENAILFIWVTYPILQEAFEVIKSWGFKYSTCGFAWVKKNKVSESWFFGNGAWTRANTELCLIATRGTVTRLDASISQVLDDRIMEHSQKPERVRELITRLVGKLPRIELFSRNTKNDGWFNWGNGI